MNLSRILAVPIFFLLVLFSLGSAQTLIASPEYPDLSSEDQAQVKLSIQNSRGGTNFGASIGSASSWANTAEDENQLSNIFNKSQNSVVQITRTVPQTGAVIDPSQENRTALGSGFLFDNQGHIITNNHVVGDAKVVDVTFTNGDRMRANVTAADPYIDIAALKIIETQNNTLNREVSKPLPIGNSSTLTGDQVIAIGNPYGLAGTMTTGIVSQVGRLVPAPSSEFSVPDVIQTDAAINPGNSGGPLLNLQGQVVGVNFAVLGQGLGFAIPINLIQKVVPVLVEKGNYTHPYLGFTGTTLTSDSAASIENIPLAAKGVYVNTLVEGGPADIAGLQGVTVDQYGRRHGGDVIVGVDGDDLREFEQLVSYLEANTVPGDNVVLNIIRNGTEVELNATMGERPYSSSSSSSSSSSAPPPNDAG